MFIFLIWAIILDHISIAFQPVLTPAILSHYNSKKPHALGPLELQLKLSFINVEESTEIFQAPGCFEEKKKNILVTYNVNVINKKQKFIGRVTVSKCVIHNGDMEPD